MPPGAIPRRRALVALLVALATALALLASAPAADADQTADVSVVEVMLPDAAAHARLAGSGLDVVDVGRDRAELYVHDARDAARLRRLDLRSRVVEADAAASARARASEAALASELAEDPAVASALPTGRVSYRDVETTNAELRALAAAHPDRAELLELPEPSLLGTPVLGLYISSDGRRDRGRPVFLTSGVHHAREWPTVEFTTELAHEVLAGDDPRLEALLAEADLLVVPMVNPDGYGISRSLVQEQKRKNCRVVHGEVPTYAECVAEDNQNLGTDLNRNYGAFFGGPGSSTRTTASNHHGEGPFSEPEIRNMRALATTHQITVAMNNHTPDARLLRAPSASNEPTPADADAYQALAEEIGAVLDWPAGPWTEIYYEASGTAEQTAYYGAGTFAFTPEATPGFSGLERFHPPYEYVVEQYRGTGFYEGSSMREAQLVAWEAAGDPSKHATIVGRVTRGAELTATKSFVLDTSPFTPADDGVEVVLPVPMTYTSTMRAAADGSVEWHVNPSLRPSQEASEHLVESWTISCVAHGGRETLSTEVTVGRGEVAELELDGCRRGPRIPTDVPRRGRG